MKRIKILFAIIACGSLVLITSAFASTWNDYKNSKPDALLDDIVDHASSDIVKTKLDGTSNTQVYGAPYKLSGTLESVRQNLSYYIQWIAYIALTAAVILLVYNGLLLVLTPVTSDQATKIRTRMMYIAIGILLVTGFYFVLKILLAIYYQIFVR